jgi:serine/threonine protein kinase
MGILRSKKGILDAPPPAAPMHHCRNIDHSTLDISSMSHGSFGELVITWWSSWLTSVAREIVEGWLPRRASMIKQLDKITVDNN